MQERHWSGRFLGVPLGGGPEGKSFRTIGKKREGSTAPTEGGHAEGTETKTPTCYDYAPKPKFKNGVLGRRKWNMERRKKSEIVGTGKWLVPQAERGRRGKFHQLPQVQTEKKKTAKNLPTPNKIAKTEKKENEGTGGMGEKGLKNRKIPHQAVHLRM